MNDKGSGRDDTQQGMILKAVSISRNSEMKIHRAHASSVKFSFAREAVVMLLLIVRPRNNKKNDGVAEAR